MPYQTIVYKELVAQGYSIYVVYLDKKRKTPYDLPEIPNVLFYPKSGFTSKDLLSFILKINPCIMVVAGWSEVDYLNVSRIVRKKINIPVVSVIDTQFIFRIKQIIGFLTSKFYIKPSFSHFWVPGVRQYEFARLLGYKKENIIFNSLSCDVNLFNKANVNHKENNYPKNFLYVGRYSPEKGLELLIEAWVSIVEKKGWTLTLVGNGPLKEKLTSIKSIKVLDFMEQTELVKLAQNSGCFVLPSLYEPWALVIQEFAAAGLPIICSDACGASTFFVENGYNGYIFKTGDFKSLSQCLNHIINLDSENLVTMGKRSVQLSNRVTPEISAFSLLSIINGINYK